MSSRVGKVVAAAALMAALSAVVGAAWACTVQATLVGVNPIAGPEGTAVRVQGEGLAAASSHQAGGRVDVRWDGADGPVVGVGTVDADGRFSADISVPRVAPGVHYLLAVVKGEGVARTAFQVTSAATAGGPVPAPVASAALSAWDSSPAEVPPSPGNGLLVGMGLLGFGLAALASGFAVMTRRRTVAARP